MPNFQQHTLTIKHTIAAILLLFNYTLAFTQDSLPETLFQTNSKTHLYYVDIKKSLAYVYEMSTHMDVAGKGYSITNADTLTGQPDGNYLGKTTKLIHENNELYLVTEFKKPKKFVVDPVTNSVVANHKLNNGYYLDKYFKMSDELNKTYPLDQHSFRNGFYTWRDLPERDLDHLQFREFANKRLKEIKDSLSSLRDNRVALTNFIIQKLGAMDYHALKDSLMKLPAETRNLSWYYGTVINEVAKQRPGYFFRLAEDFPDNRSLIFNAVEKDKEVIEGLKTVEGHDEIKKEFFKKRKF